MKNRLEGTRETILQTQQFYDVDIWGDARRGLIGRLCRFAYADLLYWSTSASSLFSSAGIPMQKKEKTGASKVGKIWLYKIIDAIIGL